MAEQKATAKAEPKKLGRASESSDPAVHQVLAEIQTARANGDEKAVEAAQRKLADLGFE